MTDQQHPLTPPPELERQWIDNDDFPFATGTLDLVSITKDRLRSIATQAARWGADQELEACCEWLGREVNSGWGLGAQLLAARRPKPPSLKEQALECLKNIDDACESEGFSLSDYTDIIRHALEALLLD